MDNSQSKIYLSDLYLRNELLKVPLPLTFLVEAIKFSQNTYISI